MNFWYQQAQNERKYYIFIDFGPYFANFTPEMHENWGKYILQCKISLL